MDRKFVWFGISPELDVKEVLQVLLKEGFVGWGWVETGDLSHLIDRDWTEVKKEIKQRIWKHYRQDSEFSEEFGETLEEFNKVAEQKFESGGGNFKSFEYLLHKEKRIKPGDIVVIRRGNHIYAIGLAISDYEYNEKLRDMDLSHGVRVRWLVFNEDLSPIATASTRQLAPIRYVQNDRPLIIDILKKHFNVGTEEELDMKLNEILKEALNAYKFRKND